MALPLLAVVMPANVVFVKKVIDGIVNFQIIEKDTVREQVIEPLFGPSDDADETTEEEKDST